MPCYTKAMLNLVHLMTFFLVVYFSCEATEKQQDVTVSFEELVKELKLSEQEINDLKIVHDLNRDGYFSLEESDEAVWDVTQKLSQEKLKELLLKVVESRKGQVHDDRHVPVVETPPWKFGFREVGLVVFLLLLAAIGYGMTRKRQEQLGRAPSAAELRNARLSKLTRSSPQEPSQLPQKDGKSDISQKNVRKRKHENQESSHKSPAALKQNYDDCDNDRADSEDAAVVGKTETEPLISTVTNAHTAKEDQQDISTAEMTGSVRSPALAVPKTKVKQKKQQQHGRG
ncbi:uncharacterized protein LOC106153810 [Lingula anatina]|uniref:Uncharacterized protein LOC106153810 n=1 Tax=Lingula anatina TaxID=7574 RepID=A0A1S3HBG5_LINAN|nr:uncharacterized protein LOC106153810 [Lingula anatina]|eukprot:XP_013383363.1 uncharacterized protein LOC106153810 [Lingula anatina]